MVTGLKIISIKNATKIKVIKIQVHWHEVSSVALLSWQSTVRHLKKLSAAYTDFSKSSLRITSWPHNLSPTEQKTFQTGTENEG